MCQRLFGSVTVVLLTAGLAPAQPLPVNEPPPLQNDTTCCASPLVGSQNCQSDSRLWANADYLLWWIRKGPLPVPLVTTGSENDALPGVPGQPGTRVLFGGSGTDYG